MLKISLILLFLLSCGTTAKTQEVYNYVLNNAIRTVQSPTSGFTQTRIAQFKQTALTYLRKKATETMPEVTDQFLNTQAYYMSEFITLGKNTIIRSALISRPSMKSSRARSRIARRRKLKLCCSWMPARATRSSMTRTQKQPTPTFWKAISSRLSLSTPTGHGLTLRQRTTYKIRTSPYGQIALLFSKMQ